MLNVRPRLIAASPVVFWIVLGFCVFNLVIAYSLYTLHPVVPLVIVSRYITLRIWAFVFGLNGGFMAIGLIINHWTLLRWTMLAGLFIKLLWFFGLFLRMHVGGSLFLTALWSLITFVQAVSFIYFMPGEYHVR